MMAPGAGSAARSYRCPGPDEAPPRVDDYRTDIDFENEEMVGGVVYQVFGADYPHARRNGHLDYLLQGIAAPGYGTASDLKTRVDDDDDFASDSALVKDDADPETGTRHLEEIAFEVVSEQNRGIVTEKAPRMIQRGVRRVFAVFVKKKRVAEWSPGSSDWVTLHPSALIEDPILVEPLEVAAVLDAAKADDAVVRGLAKKNNPEILRIREKERTEGKAEGRIEGKAEGRIEGKAEGRIEGKAEGQIEGKAEGRIEGKVEGRIETLQQAILSIFAARRLDVSEAVHDAVLSCTDTAVLDRWHQATVTAAVAEDILRA